MDKLFITGPAKLSGTVKVSCAKNAFLPILSAVVLSPKQIILEDLPMLRDINTMIRILENMGVKVERQEGRTLFDASSRITPQATYDLVKTMRASIFILGPLLTRFKWAKVSLPGGCAIGPRPIDIHLQNLEKMGAKINLEGGYVEAHTEGLVGCKLVLSFPSVGATENLMMAATRARGTTVIENAALEPEIVDLAAFLSAMGFKISGAGSSVIKVEGIENEAQLQQVKFRAIGDRIEAATYLMAGLITNSQITVSGIRPELLEAVIAVLKDMGAQIETGKDYIKTYPSSLKGARVETAPFPGFPTDSQAQLTALATQVGGTSIISENIFENRFMHVPELCRMGAQINLKGNSAIIEGGTHLKSAPVMCTDLRASAALVIAALCATGETEIQRVYHLDRGYEMIDKKLTQLGVKVRRVNS